MSARSHPPASPYARRLAREKKRDLSHIKGTGPGGRIVARDVESAPSPAAPAPSTQAQSAQAPPSFSQTPDPKVFYDKESYEESPLSPAGLAMAKRMAGAWRDIPHFFVSMDFQADALQDLREQINQKREKPISWNVFITRAVARVLMEHPEVNISFAGKTILRHKHADIGMAVATDAGLITPILWRAEEQSLEALMEQIAQAAEKARARKLLPKDYEGGSFSISNLGMFGVDHFTAIINPPQAAILAVGGLKKTPQGLVLSCTLSSDHRVIDGATAARFMQRLRHYVENPSLMFL